MKNKQLAVCTKVWLFRAVFGVVSMVIMGCGNSSEKNDDHSSPPPVSRDNRPVDSSNDETELSDIERLALLISQDTGHSVTTKMIEEWAKTANTSVEEFVRNKLAVFEWSETDRNEDFGLTSEDDAVVDSETPNPADFEIPDGSEPEPEPLPSPVVEPVQKPNPEELMERAIARLNAKRANKKEEESRENASAEDRRRVLREKTAKELMEGMVSIPGARFKMGKTEVTGAQWSGIMGENPSVFKYDDHPVDSVSWNDVQKFLKTVNDIPSVKEAGIHFRLPSPDEWEYACRAGSTGQFGLLPNGQEGSESSMAWYCSNTSNGSTTKPVGKKSPNAWGLYDMHGNVWEYTSKLDFDYAEARGGCFGHHRDGITADSTASINRNEGRQWHGFRLCADSGD